MVEEIPWQLFKESASSFVHDSLSELIRSYQWLWYVTRENKSPQLQKIYSDIKNSCSEIKLLHSELFEWRSSEHQPPKEEFEQKLANYRTKLAELNLEISPLLRRLTQFATHSTHPAEQLEKINLSIKSLQIYLGDFPANKLGELTVKLKELNIYSLLKKFCSKRFIDRNGNSVKVVFRGKNTGLVNLDPVLFHRGMDNLITDAYNHTPGRPIYVTLSAKNGHAVINVTNEGKQFTAEELLKIGRVRFTRAMHDPKRGYGKISTKFLTEAQDGRYYAANSRIGPRSVMEFPRKRQVKRAIPRA